MRVGWLLGLFAANVAFAGGIHVGGGDAVVCYNPDRSLKDVEMLDFFEASNVWQGLKPDLGTESGPGDSYHPYIAKVIGRAKLRSPRFAAHLQDYVEDFIEHAVFLDNAKLVDVNDADYSAIPYNCEVWQIARQINPRYPEEPRYLVDEGLFHAMELNNRAALALHEALYRMAREGGQETSDATRYLNAYLMSAKVATDTDKEFQVHLVRAGFTSEHWIDKKNNIKWALFEKGNELPQVCDELSKGYSAPTIQDLQQYRFELAASRIGSMLWANQSAETSIFSGDLAEHSAACEGRGSNQYHVAVIARSPGQGFRVESRCYNKPGPFVLCMQKF